LSALRYKLDQAANRATEAREDRRRAEEEVAELRLQQIESAAASAKLVQDLQEERNSAEAAADRLERRQQPSAQTNTIATQTKLLGSHIEHEAADRTRLKVMLEELQLKVRELVRRSGRKGVEIDAVAEELGLGEVLSRRTVFERLYSDAIDRVDRLEKLRKTVEDERAALVACLPPEAAAFMEDRLKKFFSPQGEISVWSAVESSPMSGLRRLAKQCEISGFSPMTSPMGAAIQYGRPRPAPLSPVDLGSSPVVGSSGATPTAAAVLARGRPLEKGSGTPVSSSSTPHDGEVRAPARISPSNGLVAEGHRMRRNASHLLAGTPGGGGGSRPPGGGTGGGGAAAAAAAALAASTGRAKDRIRAEEPERFAEQPANSKRRPLGSSSSLPSIHQH